MLRHSITDFNWTSVQAPVTIAKWSGPSDFSAAFALIRELRDQAAWWETAERNDSWLRSLAKVLSQDEVGDLGRV